MLSNLIVFYLLKRYLSLTVYEEKHEFVLAYSFFFHNHAPWLADTEGLSILSTLHNSVKIWIVW